MIRRNRNVFRRPNSLVLWIFVTVFVAGNLLLAGLPSSDHFRPQTVSWSRRRADSAEDPGPSRSRRRGEATVAWASVPRAPLCKEPPGPDFHEPIPTMTNDSVDASLMSDLDIEPGGHWRPRMCTARHNLAIVVPYRDREIQKHIFLKHMHDFLQKQNLEYTIYFVELPDGPKFNRGLLRNIGFLEASRLDPRHGCTIFHDVDLLPTDHRNSYVCPPTPHHLCLAVNYVNDYQPLSSERNRNFGGVVAFTATQFREVNGYSNVYVEWGGEDDDLGQRVRAKGMAIKEYPTMIGRYFGVRHRSDKPQTHNKRDKKVDRFKLLRVGEERIGRDGLNTTEYKLLDVSRQPLYTRIRVQIEEKQYIRQARKEERLYKKYYRDLTPYWASLEYVPKKYYWKDTPHSAKVKRTMSHKTLKINNVELV